MGALWGSYAAYVPVIKTQIGAEDWQFGLLLTISAVGLLASMLWAPRYDRVMGRWAMPVANVLLCAAFILPGIAWSPLTFGLAMLCVACASGQSDIVMNARISEIEAREDRTLMNLAHGLFSVGYAIGAVTAGIAREASVTAPQLAVGAFFVLSLFGLFSAMDAEQDAPGENKSASVPWPVLICGGAIVLLAFMNEGATEAWSAIHIERGLGGGAAEGALGPATLGITMAVGRLSGQVLTTRIGETRLIAIATGMTALGAWLAAAAATPLVAYIGFGILGLGVSVIAPTALALVGKQAGKGSRTTAISRVVVIGFSGFFIGPPIMGGLSQAFGLPVAFVVLGGLVLIVFPLLKNLTPTK